MWGVCRRMYLIWRRLQFLSQIQDDFGGKHTVLGGEIVHTFVLGRGGDHRANTDAVECFIKAQICPARIVYLNEQPFGTVLNLNINISVFTI